MKTFTITFLAPLLAALLSTSVLAAPAQSYPGCEAATNAAAAGDQTALKNAIAACNAAGTTTGSSSSSSSQSYPGCEAATNAAAISDQTALKNAIAACKAAGTTTDSPSTPATNGTTPAAGSDYNYTPVAWSASGNCYECGPSSEYYQPGCHCENCKYVTCG